MRIESILVEPKNGLIKTIQTMQYLERLAMDNAKFVSWVYNQFNTNCSPCVPGKIWNYMIDSFTYRVDDPFDELITAPYLMPELKTGDCDDFSLFAKTCLDILGGWFTNYLLLGEEKNRFTHVVVFCHRGRVGDDYIDPVIIDGTNHDFNVLPLKFKWMYLC